jgi:hypothetical protein
MTGSWTLRGRTMPSKVLLMSSTSFAYPQVFSRRFAFSNLLFSQVKSIYAPSSIPGSSTKHAGRTPFDWRMTALKSPSRTRTTASMIAHSSSRRPFQGSLLLFVVRRARGGKSLNNGGIRGQIGHD